MNIFSFSIYSMRHSVMLARVFASGGRETFDEGRRWVTGHELFQQATQSGQYLPIIFSSADITDRLHYWALLTDLSIADTDGARPGTWYSFDGLREISGNLPLASLRLRSTGKQMSNKNIRPYAICHTPEFVLRNAVRGLQAAAKQSLLPAERGRARFSNSFLRLCWVLSPAPR